MTNNCGFLNGHALYRYGPTLDTHVGFDPNYRPNMGGRPALPSDKRLALVDTGAMDCCIDSQLAVDLQLPSVDRITISGAGGPINVNLHLAQLYVPALDWVMWGTFAGVHLAAGGQLHQVLVGRLLLRDFRMDYNGLTGEAHIGS